MVSTKMQESDNTVLPAVVGGVVTVLIEIRDNYKDIGKWIHAVISGLISFSTAYYLVPAVLAYISHTYNNQLLKDINIISLAGFIGGLLGGKLINLFIYLFDRYSKRAADKAARRFLGDLDNSEEEPRGDLKSKS